MIITKRLRKGCGLRKVIIIFGLRLSLKLSRNSDMQLGYNCTLYCTDVTSVYILGQPIPTAYQPLQPLRPSNCNLQVTRAGWMEVKTQACFQAGHGAGNHDTSDIPALADLTHSSS